MNWREYLIFPIHFIYNVNKLYKYIHVLRKNESGIVVYTSHKKRLAEAWILKILTGTEYIYHIRTYDSRKNILYSITSIWMKGARQCIAVSHVIADNVKLANVNVIHNPINMQTYPIPKKNKDPFTVAVFSSLLSWKGIDIFMQSHKQLKYDKNIIYEVYGDGPIYKQLKNFESENVRLMGFTNDVYRILKNRISLVCVPSVKPESFGRVSLEAFSFGIPAIASDIGGQKEIIDNDINGFLVEPGDSKAISKCVDLLFENRSLYNSFSNEAFKKASYFSFDKFENQISRIFNV